MTYHIWCPIRRWFSHKMAPTRYQSKYRRPLNLSCCRVMCQWNCWISIRIRQWLVWAKVIQWYVNTVAPFPKRQSNNNICCVHSGWKSSTRHLPLPDRPKSPGYEISHGWGTTRNSAGFCHTKYSAESVTNALVSDSSVVAARAHAHLRRNTTAQHAYAARIIQPCWNPQLDQELCARGARQTAGDQRRTKCTLF